jgi:glycine/D-amino acid oxidase-like deaminating enzyme
MLCTGSIFARPRPIDSPDRPPHYSRLRGCAIGKTVAILGAGIQGTCAALALAARGCKVDLFDQATQPVTQASLWNEGKIHLGLIYAKDTGERTSDILLRGALHFDSALQRLTGRDRPADLVSRPFQYAVHRGSQLSVNSIAAHFESVADRYRTLRRATGLSYFDHASDFVWEPMSNRTLRAEYDDRRIAAAFRSVELSVDPAKVAAMLRQAVAEQDAIRFHPGRRVEAVRVDSTEGPRVALAGEGMIGPYDEVVNALWQDRLRVDATAGLHPGRPWLHRYKLAIHIAGAAGSAPASTSIMLGEYGDIVDFGGGRHYLSWYPACKLGEWREICPPDMPAQFDEEERRRIVDASLEELGQIAPPLRALDLSRATIDVRGGYIFAWGRSDIADPDSELHRRSDIGIHSNGRYHSIDTGKYCMAPHFAELLVERLCGKTVSVPGRARQATVS